MTEMDYLCVIFGEIVNGFLPANIGPLCVYLVVAICGSFFVRVPTNIQDFQGLVWFLCVSVPPKCRNYLHRSHMLIRGIGNRRVLSFIYMIVFLSSCSFAASSGENNCNRACNESTEHFCKHLYSSIYMCMKCEMVCVNEDSQSDKEDCKKYCQGSEFFLKQPTTIHPTTPNSSTLITSTSLIGTYYEAISSSVGLETSQGDIVPLPSHSSDFRYLLTIAFLAMLVACFLAWLYCHCSSQCKRSCKVSSSHNTVIFMQEVRVENEGTAPYQTGRPQPESIAMPPSDERQQEEVPDSLRTNRAFTKGTAVFETTPNTFFSPEADQDPSKSKMALSEDSSKTLPALALDEK